MKKLSLLFVIASMLIPTIACGGYFSYIHYESLLKHYVKAGVNIHGVAVNAVDYAALAAEAKRPDSNYILLLKDLAAFDPTQLGNKEEKIAFWINVYNIGAIKTIVDYYPVDSIRNRKINWLGQPWNRKTIVVGGKEFSLAEIENEILLDGFKDLRIHFGINCASISCVDLLSQPYRAPVLYTQLEEQGRKFLSDRKRGLFIDREKKVIFLSQIFKFDKERFETLGGALAFIKPYVHPTDKDLIDGGGLRIDYLEYDWDANDLKNAF